MTGSPTANSNEQAERTDECVCPPVARRDRLDGVDLAALAARAQRFRFPVPAPDTIVGATVIPTAD